MLMLYELEVLQSDSERIGDPVALPLTDIINGGGNTNRLGRKRRICSAHIVHQVDEFLETENTNPAQAPSSAARRFSSEDPA